MTGEYTYLKRIKVNTSFLKPGMYVSKLDKPWNESKFLFQGFPLHTEEDILAVQAECAYVYVDFRTRQQYQQYLRYIESAPKTRKFPKKTDESLLKELPRAQKSFKRSSKLVKSVMQSIILDQDFDLASVKEAVKECVESILSNDDAFMLLTQIKNNDEYTAEHCLRVAIMAIAFGKFLGMDKDSLVVIGIAGMLHDVGKMKTPDHILNKPGRLTDEEFDVMKNHAVLGYEILLKKRHLEPAAIDVAYSHHERINGNGYPRGLPGYKISRFARLISIIDTYDAITSKRCYKEAQSPTEAFRVLLNKSDTLYDQVLARRFVQWMGVYPVGSLVEMQTGEVGIVIRIYETQKLRPRVLLVTDENKKSGYQKVIDLSHMAVHSNGQPYQVKTMHPNGAFGIKLQKFIDQGLKLETQPK